MQMFVRLTLLLCALVLSSGAPSFSYAAATEKPTAGKATPNTPAQVTTRKTQVSVTHVGTDTIGIRLSTRLKELFNGSNLFQLNENDAPKMRILVQSKAEFSDRPHVGSVYSVIWVFSQSEGHLGYLLADDVAVLSSEDVDAIATKIVERTDGIAVKYGYLFQ